MDPNVTLHAIREQVARALAAKKYLAAFEGTPSLPERALHELAQSFEELDGHMSGGGDKPDAWKETEDHR